MKLLIDRVYRAMWCTLALCIRHFIKTKNNKVICWSFLFEQYGCNPKYISEYILKYCEESFDIVWVIKKNVETNSIPSKIRIVRPNTFKYLQELYSAKFVISNIRNMRSANYFFKKANQIYIMTWHGPFALKKIEFDAIDSLGSSYIRQMKDDNRICDLMLSSCTFFTSLIRNAFMYKGEILEKGAPRNDLFFDIGKKDQIREKIFNDYNIPNNTKIVTYAPTFRNDKEASHYKLNWRNIIPAFEEMLGAPVIVFLRLHPVSIGIIDIDSLIQDDKIRNMTSYNDMQELILISEVLITDYSSTMFEMGILNKICILYADDVDSYERGFYFDVKNLPFRFAENECQLTEIVRNFDFETYFAELKEFNNNKLNIFDNGQASASVVKWMLDKCSANKHREYA